MIRVKRCYLHDALARSIGIDRLFAAKLRYAAETGAVFMLLQELAP